MPRRTISAIQHHRATSRRAGALTIVQCLDCDYRQDFFVIQNAEVALATHRLETIIKLTSEEIDNVRSAEL